MYDYNRTWSRLFKKNVLGTKLEIYVSIGPFSRQNIGTEDMLVIFVYCKMKNEKYHSVGTVLKLNSKIAVRGNIDPFYKQMHDRPLLWCGTGSSIKKNASLN